MRAFGALLLVAAAFAAARAAGIAAPQLDAARGSGATQPDQASTKPVEVRD